MQVTQLCLTLPSDLEGTFDALNQYPETEMGWMRTNKLVLNDKETDA